MKSEKMNKKVHKIKKKLERLDNQTKRNEKS